jgi:hypothetical protein
LTTKKEALVKVELIGGKFDLRDLGSLLGCYHLKILKIIECNMLELDEGVSLHDLVSEIEETYKNVNLDKLHNIVLRECSVFGCLLILFFESGNANIKGVEVIGLMTSETEKIIGAILRYCMNLKEFKLSIENILIDCLLYFLEVVVLSTKSSRTTIFIIIIIIYFLFFYYGV